MTWSDKEITPESIQEQLDWLDENVWNLERILAELDDPQVQTKEVLPLTRLLYNKYGPSKVEEAKRHARKICNEWNVEAVTASLKLGERNRWPNMIIYNIIYILRDLLDHNKSVDAQSSHSGETFYTAPPPIELPTEGHGTQETNVENAPDPSGSPVEGGSRQDPANEAEQRTFSTLLAEPSEPPDSTENLPEQPSELARFEGAHRESTSELSGNIFGSTEAGDSTGSDQEQGQVSEGGSAQGLSPYDSVASAERKGQEQPAPLAVPESPQSQEHCSVKPAEPSPQEAGQSGSLESRNSTRGPLKKPITLAAITGGRG
ncbi:hypothetical protein BDV24DRAFT_170227 [Aspergillus arachidicola]|uniref:Uncharacterized protein n=1 Tax=Aspergillus arachidicola TaxID=656916 RepID=A0A5N6XN74_9EURO|nr:hypothetical protein BDV24DRAFT_170227 [Aspergillus arachidicola]